MALQTEKRYYTPQEYLELEEQAEFKNEYRDGEIIPMTGGTTGASHFFVCHCERNEVERSNLSNSCVSD